MEELPEEVERRNVSMSDESKSVHESDVFMAYHKRDKEIVLRVAQELRSNGVSAFTEIDLVPGGLWQDQTEDAIQASKCAAIFVGNSGVRGWHRQEMRAALDKAIESDVNFRVFPVHLPGSGGPESIRGFLGNRVGIDLTSGVDAKAIQKLIAAVRGKSPGSSDEEEQIEDSPRPYRGIEPFHQENSEFYFRDEAVTQLVETLKDKPFLTIAGPSGSGKSSLVRAGLATNLAEELWQGITSWKRLEIDAGRDPFCELCKTVSRKNHSGEIAHRELEVRESLIRYFGQSCGVIVIDQLEEIFTQNRDAESKQRAGEQLGTLLESLISTPIDGLRIIATLRADFIASLLDGCYPRLQRVIEKNQMWLGAITPGELKKAIIEPATRRGAMFETGLVDKILSEMRGERSALPLLQECLDSLWDYREGPWLTHSGFEKTKGVRGALNEKADRAFDTLSPSQKKIVRRVFLKLVQVERGTKPTRRRISKTTLMAAADDVSDFDLALEQFSRKESRLLVFSTLDRGIPTETAEIVHEALIDHWDRLQNWLRDAGADLELDRRLEQAAIRWRELGQKSGNLWRPPELDLVVRRYEELSEDWSDDQLEFVDASKLEYNREQRRSRLLFSLKIASPVLSILVIVVLIRLQIVRKSANYVLVNGIKSAETSQLEPLMEQAWLRRVDMQPMLQAELDQPSIDPSAKLNLALTMHSLGYSKLGVLQNEVVRLSAQDLVLVSEVLQKASTGDFTQLWKVLENDLSKREERFRAACALAQVASNDDRWNKHGEFVVDFLIKSYGSDFDTWIELVRPISSHMKQHLIQAASSSTPSGIREFNARLALTRLHADDIKTLVSLLRWIESAEEFQVVEDVLTQADESKREAKLRLSAISASTDNASPEEIAKEKAKLAILLCRREDYSHFLSILGDEKDPTAASWIVKLYGDWHGDPHILAKLLRQSRNPLVRSRLICSLSACSVKEANVSAISQFLSSKFAVERSAAQWFLTDRFGQVRVSSAVPPKTENSWRINTLGMVLVTLEGDEFAMGAPEDEPGFVKENERQHRRVLRRRFEIATTSVTQEQFRQFRSEHPGLGPSSEGDLPITQLTWFEAVEFCNWLTRQEETLGPQDLCYEPNADGKYEVGMRIVADNVRRAGYRLPTDAEYEFACRGGSKTSRNFGDSYNLMSRYGWCSGNADRAQPVGLKMPNSFGLFDMHGNVYNWCQPQMTGNPKFDSVDDEVEGETVVISTKRIIRGQCYSDPPKQIRSADKSWFTENERNFQIGFRVVRTVSPKSK